MQLAVMLWLISVPAPASAAATVVTPGTKAVSATAAAEAALATARRLDRTDPEAAVTELQQALAKLQHDDPVRVEVLTAIARIVDDRLHDPISALPWWEAAWESSLRFGVLDEAEPIGWQLAEVYQSSGRVTELEELLRERANRLPEASSRANARRELIDLIARHRPDDPELLDLETQLLADGEASAWSRAGVLGRRAQRAGAGGHHEQAVELLEQAVAIRHADDGDAGYERRQLAASLAAAGRLADALALLDELLALEEDEKGTEHPDLHWILGPLADLQSRLGRIDEALATLDRARTIAWRAYGPRSSRSEQVAEARAKVEERRNRVVASDEAAFFSCSCSCTETPDPIGERLAAGDYEGARTLAREQLAAAELEHGVDAVETAEVLGHVAARFQQLDRRLTAGLRERQWRILAARRGLDHPDVLALSTRLAWDLTSLGKADLALRYREAAVAGWAATGLESSVEWTTALGSLARAQTDLADHGGASATLARAVAMAEASYGRRAPEALRMRCDLARSLISAGRHDEALELLDAVIAEVEQHDHPRARQHLLTALAIKAQVYDQLGQRDRAREVRARVSATAK